MLTKAEKAKIHWHCRRGMLELDTLIMPFFTNSFESLSKEEQEQFIALLECSDLDLFHWLLKQKEAPSQHSRIIELILKSNEKQGMNRSSDNGSNSIL